MTAALQQGATLHGSQHTYELQRELGRGGFGVTYLARRDDGLSVALKALLIGQLKQWKSLELFEREIAVLRGLDHPHIPDYVDHFQLGDDPDVPDGLVLVQEHVDGFGLDSVVRGERRLDPAQMVSWLTQILEVLAYLHQLSPPVIHRDVSPKNILLREDGAAYLVDFGTVQAAARSASDVSTTSAGTFGYAPMEQFVGSAGPGSDLYGLGMTFLAVAAGREPSEMPFVGTRVDVQAAARLDARLAILLEKMTEPDPGRRLNDARVALEQLRPLLQRYAPREGVEPAALQQAAALIQAEQVPSGRPRVEADDLLPSERIRAARERLERIDAPLPLPVLDDAVASLDQCAIATSGAVVCIDHHVLDTASLSRVARLRKNAFVAACNASGDTLVARPQGADKLIVLTRDGKGYREGPELKLALEDGLVVSPDGRSLARPGGDGLELFDLRTGALSQRIEGSFAEAGYSADGRTLFGLEKSWRLRLMHADGNEEAFDDCCGIAFAHDGQNVALFVWTDGRLLIGPLEQLRRGQAPVAVAVESTRHEHACFSPDGQWLAAEASGKVLVFDARTGRLVHTLVDPAQPEDGGMWVQGLGFTADSGRLLARVETHCNRFAGTTRRCLALWALPSGRFVGAVLQASGSPRTLVHVAAEGFRGRQHDKTGELAEAGPSPWERPEVARRALCGEPADKLLDETERARLADLEQRWAFFSDLRARGQLDGEADLGALVEACAGLTHLLDRVVRGAREAQSDGPAFGAGAAARSLTADHVIAAARDLSGRPADQLDTLYQDLLREAQQAELTRAREVARTQAAAPPPAAVQQPATTPRAAAPLGTAEERKIRIMSARGGYRAFGIGIAAALAAAGAAFAIPGWAVYGYAAIHLAGLLLLLLLLGIVTIEVDRGRGIVRAHRSPWPVMVSECPLDDAEVKTRIKRASFMGRLSTDFRVYLRMPGAIDKPLYRGGGRTPRANQIIERVKALLHPPG